MYTNTQYQRHATNPISDTQCPPLPPPKYSRTNIKYYSVSWNGHGSMLGGLRLLMHSLIYINIAIFFLKQDESVGGTL